MMKISLQTHSDAHSRATGNLQSIHTKRERGRKEDEEPEDWRNGKKRGGIKQGRIKRDLYRDTDIELKTIIP